MAAVRSGLLPNFVSSQVRLFADDCLLYRTISSIEDQLKLQADLKSLEDWASTWGMSFNPSKCTIMSISRSSSPFIFFYSLCSVILQQVDEAKYLGVLLSSDFMWSKHIQHLVSKANSTMGLLRRNLTTSSAKLREQAFISLVRSRLEYCCAIWDPHLAKDRDNLEAVQRRAVRFVTQDYSRDTSITQLLKDLVYSMTWQPNASARFRFVHILWSWFISSFLVLMQSSFHNLKIHLCWQKHYDITNISVQV